MSYIVKLSEIYHYECFAECNSEEEARQKAIQILESHPNRTQTYYVTNREGFVVESVDKVNEDAGK